MAVYGGERASGGGKDRFLRDADDLPADEATPLDTAQLAFAEEDVRLPWLETDDDDDEDYGRYNSAQLIALFAIGLLAIAVIGGGLWWAVSHRNDQVQIAEGSVIAAPQQPYKERPKDAGGKTFAGTGDTAFAVSEGQTRPARLGDAPAAKSAPAAAPKASAAPAGLYTAGVGVQVAAYSNRAQAESSWTRLAAQYEVLSGVRHRVQEGQADIGTVYRLQAVVNDLAAAHELCRKLKAAGLACQVKN